MTTLPLILQREIEAKMAVALINGYADEIGAARALALAGETIQGLAQDAGRQWAAKQGGNTLKDLARVVREVWAREDALEITVHHAGLDQLRFDVRRCRYAELYDRLGFRKMGVQLSCGRDAAFAQGFNPAIRMKRHQTIMEGAPHCDFCFYLTASPG